MISSYRPGVALSGMVPTWRAAHLKGKVEQIRFQIRAQQVWHLTLASWWAVLVTAYPDSRCWVNPDYWKRSWLYWTRSQSRFALNIMFSVWSEIVGHKESWRVWLRSSTQPHFLCVSWLPTRYVTLLLWWFSQVQRETLWWHSVRSAAWNY